MRFVVILLLLFSILILTPCALAATIYGGEVYSGDTFTSSIGGIFTVYGTDPVVLFNNATQNDEQFYRLAYISSNVDDAISLRNGTCKESTRYTYCFKSQRIDMSKEKTFLGDYLQPVLTVTIDTLPLPTAVVLVTRPQITQAYCGDTVEMSIFVNNTGTSDANVTYVETLPLRTVVLDTPNGDVKDNTITFKDILSHGYSRNFTYKISVLDCDSKHWDAKYTITSYNYTSSKTINDISLEMQQLYTINETLIPNATNKLMSESEYIWAITNNHPSMGLSLESFILVPNLTVTQASATLIESGDSYKYVGSISSGETVKLHLVFNTKKYGAFTIRHVGKLSVDNRNVEFNSSQVLRVVPANLTFVIYANTSINGSVFVTINASNDNFVDKYYYVYGNLKGFSEDELVYNNGVDAGMSAIVFNKTFNTSGMGVIDKTIAFDGIYRDKNSLEYKVHVEKTFRTNTPPALIVDTPIPVVVNNDAVSSPSNVPTEAASPDNTSGQVDSGAASQPPPEGPSAKPVTPGQDDDFITKLFRKLNDFLQSIFG